MRIAIASMGKDEDSGVSLMAGRPPFYLIFEDNKLVKTIKNPFAVGGGGAGFAVAKMLADEEVNLVVAGKFGGNMTSALEEKNIKYIELQDMKVKEALEKCQDHSD
jgi:predicted Fe-Mo cluster-binding NifX family protein